MTKEKISHREVQDALKEFKGNGGVISILPEGTKRANFGHEINTVDISLCQDMKVGLLNRESGIEHLTDLESFFAFDRA